MDEALRDHAALVAKYPSYESSTEDQDALWWALAQGAFRTDPDDFAPQLAAYHAIFGRRTAMDPPPAAWQPDPEAAKHTNIGRLMHEVGAPDFSALHAWSVQNREAFWERALDRVGAMYEVPPERVLGASPADDPLWLPGARLNCAETCFQKADDAPAVLFAREGNPRVETVTQAELRQMTERVANGLVAMGVAPGDAVALYMPMTVDCVAAYLGIVLAGAVVVSIPDSFAPPEVGTRLRIARAKAVITVDSFSRGGKRMAMYDKVVAAKAPATIVIGTEQRGALQRPDDLRWEDFLGEPGFAAVGRSPRDASNILFSSGTTGEPKAIPWTHLTPFKSAVDGHFHQDISPGDVVAWPTNIGWMMGPWLIYASLCNRATIALYEGVPTSAGFCRFVEDAGVTMLGTVPSIVRAWRRTGATKGVDWSRVQCFSSTGEASNAQDYLWLMSRAGYRAPVIEYCGGTEIGGGHITGTLVQPASPSLFSTPALGIDVVVLDAQGEVVPDGNMGEMFLVPPSIGLSQMLLNRDHHAEYYHGTPAGPNGETLRRHGDEFTRLAGGYFRAEGRADDTMNLGGIKVSSIELERTLDAEPGILETAAVAVHPPGGGADSLVVFVVLANGQEVDAALHQRLQDRLKESLNPLFRIHHLVEVETLPRTASNKVMRRTLRAQFMQGPAT